METKIKRVDIKLDDIYTAGCLEHILKATLQKTAAVPLPAAHLTNHSCKTNKTCGALLKKKKQTRDIFYMDSYP